MHVIRHGKRLGVRLRGDPGTSPGTIHIDPDAPAPVIRLIAYDAGGVTETAVVDPAEIEPHPAPGGVIWVNVDGLGDEEVLRSIADRFGMHRLALEDVVNVHQRDKVESYPDHLFIVSRMVQVNDGVQSEQVSMFLGDGYLITFQETIGDVFDPVRERIRKGQGRIRTGGPDYLAYALLDAIVDHCFPVLEHYGERLDALEEEILSDPCQRTLAQVHGLKRELLALRRAVWPKREALSALVREPAARITDETRVYLRDCYDHAIQVLDITETYRELASGLVDAYISHVSHRMNEVMKVLTIIGTIFIPLTFLAGVYGMNFKVMPELGWKWGYPVLLLVMAAIAGGLLALFRRRKWL
jgi:magnesium transporter